MPRLLDRYPELAQASPEVHLALIDELWELVRRAGAVAVQADHVQELDRRLEGIRADPSVALDPGEARALLRR